VKGKDSKRVGNLMRAIIAFIHVLSKKERERRCPSLSFLLEYDRIESKST
jgi:hypothetical protein